MTREDKELLLKDLCARLPYGVKYNYGSYDGCDYTLNVISPIHLDSFPIEDCKPYLFPLSSMTEEQELEWDDLHISPLCERMNPHTRKEDLMLRAKACYAATFWLLENHFDYRGLIEKGLAIDATGKGIY